jgi:hypothetical protein
MLTVLHCETVTWNEQSMNIYKKIKKQVPLCFFFKKFFLFKHKLCGKKRIDKADAVFIISCRDSGNKDETDQHTILRSWAIKDFAPNTPQYVALFRPENRIHVKFVGEHYLPVSN